MKQFQSVFRPKQSIAVLFLATLFVSCSDDEQQNPGYDYVIDESISLIEWKGYHKDDSFNNGTIQVQGELRANDSGHVSGEFSMPLSSLINLNLPTDELKEQLIHHLQSADFFDMALYPEVAFKLTSIKVDEKGGDAYIVTGNLTFLNKTNPVTFPATIIQKDSKIEIEGEATIDRLQWGMTYASDENAEDGLYIKPGLDFHIKLSAVRK